MSRCGSSTAASTASSKPDPLVAAARLPGDEVDIIASYTQFTQLTKRSW